MAGKKILVVDDEQGIRNILEILLSKANYTPLLAADGFEALEIITKEIGKGRYFDKIVTDNRMPKLSGIALGAFLLGYKPKEKDKSGYKKDNSFVETTLLDDFRRIVVKYPNLKGSYKGKPISIMTAQPNDFLEIGINPDQYTSQKVKKVAEERAKDFGFYSYIDKNNRFVDNLVGVVNSALKKRIIIS